MELVMEIIHERCCGVDVHKKQITICLMISGPSGRLKSKEVRRFETFTHDLESFAEWLQQNECKAVAMESTGSYWKPVFNVLEDKGIEVCLVNARHMKNVPGRKTDAKDCEWIAQLFRQGLLRPSLIPDREVRECRELLRRRKKLIQQRSSEINRLQKFLEEANIKLASVATDVMGVSSLAMIQALLAGERDTDKLAELARGTLRCKKDQLRKALRGNIRDHHILLLSQVLKHIDFINEQIEELSEDIDDRLKPHKDDIARLDQIPGVNKKAAETIIAEMGADMRFFKNSQRAASWAGVCPGNNESAGKRRSGRNTGGNKWLREILVEAATSASLTKNTFLRARYDRLVKRMGAKKARFALAHRILVIAYDILRNKNNYRELGADHYLEQETQNKKNKALLELRSLGFDVQLLPAAG